MSYALLQLPQHSRITVVGTAPGIVEHHVNVTLTGKSHAGEDDLEEEEEHENTKVLVK